MKIITFCLLCVLGLAEILQRILSQLSIYSQEMPFAEAIGLWSLPKSGQDAYWGYIGNFKEDWNILSWYGLATIALAILMLFSTRTKSVLQRPAEQVVAPNRSLPPPLNSTSTVRGPEDF